MRGRKSDYTRYMDKREMEICLKCTLPQDVCDRGLSSCPLHKMKKRQRVCRPKREAVCGGKS